MPTPSEHTEHPFQYHLPLDYDRSPAVWLSGWIEYPGKPPTPCLYNPYDAEVRLYRPIRPRPDRSVVFVYAVCILAVIWLAFQVGQFTEAIHQAPVAQEVAR